VCVNGYELAEGFLFDGIGLIFVVEDLFEFELFVEKPAGGFGVVESESAFLDEFGGVGRESSVFRFSFTPGQHHARHRCMNSSIESEFLPTIRTALDRLRRSVSLASQVRMLMKPLCALLVLGVWSGSLSPGFGQVTTVYDNGISTVNNGRVNDPNFPSFLMHADDFSLAASRQVNQVDWLGAYKNGDLLPDAPDGFTIRFFAFNGATPATTAFATYQVGAVERQLTSQTLPFGNPVFSYSAQIPLTSLATGTYLLSIMNTHTGTKQWLWADADAAPGHSYLMSSPGAAWSEFSGGGVAEFAFSLSFVPEPSAGVLILLGGSLFARARLHARSRKEGNRGRTGK
jgi:hypothetical protein